MSLTTRIRNVDELEAEAHDEIARGHEKLATAARLRAQKAPLSLPKYLDQKSCAPLSSRVYLAHARRGSFATKRVGKRVLVERAVFEKWIEGHAAHVKKCAPASVASTSLEESVIAELGAVAVGGRR